ncbi:hypothetical protein BGZ92_010184 [Podila epicladia]|nr:hypothetical protein BGZ92_010184 [Podila epicladia]
MKSLSLSAALAGMATMSSAIVTEESGCRIMQGSALCPSIQYLTKVPSTAVAEKRIQEYFDKMPSLQTPCLTALQDALCLLEFPKCADGTQTTLPVCWSVRDRVAQLCYEPFNHEHPLSGPTSDQHVFGDEGITQEQIRDSLFTPSFNTRWASSASIQEPDCVSFSDHGIGASPLENIQMVNDLGDETYDALKADRLEEERWLKEQSTTDLNADQSGLFEYDDDDVEYYAEMESMKVKRLDRRSRMRHHHHQKRSERNKHIEKRSDESAGAGKVHVAIRADEPGQAVYTVPKDGSEHVLTQQSLNHAETDKSSALDGHQRVLAQSGSNNANPADASDALGKANAGHPVSATKEAGESDEASNPKKGTVMLAAVPILLLMGAIAGFTVYRRYYENSFNQGGRNDSHDAIPGDDYHRRDLPTHKGSPIHFDRTFLNTIHSPPPTATYLHDPENNSRHQSPSSIAAGNMKRPPPSAGSHGKTRFQELSRSYDFGAGFRSIKNALSRSNNNSRDALDKATSVSGSNNSLGKNHAFGAGGHSLAKIGSHPGLNALERQQLQQQYGASGGPSGSGSGSRFPDIHNMVSQEHSIVWGQYSADDDGVYHDASTTLASNLARKSASSNSLSGGKYSHHHQQSSGHQQPGTPTDSIGDCLSPESPSMSREELMRRREMFAPAYTFGSESSAATDSHSGTDLLFDARDHFFDIGNEKTLDTQLHDEEMDMYLSMEKEESPYEVDDFNSMNPVPYEPKVMYRHLPDPNLIQKSAPMSEKESLVRPSISIGRTVEESFDEKAALKALDEEEEGEGTHVLGNASPEWSQTIGAVQEQAVGRLSANAAIGATAVALGSSMQESGSTEFDPADWEEDLRSTSTTSLATSMGGGGNKGSKKKSKSKKGRKH